jgi:hypothetical protein
MERYLPGQPLLSLSELRENEIHNGKPLSDPYTVAYKKNLEAGMSDILAHFEATIAIEGGEDKIAPEFMEHVRRHRKEYRKRIGNNSAGQLIADC